MNAATVSYILGIAGIVTLAVTFGRWLWTHILRPMARLTEEWMGEAERRGPSGVITAAAKPGVMERLTTIETHGQSTHEQLVAHRDALAAAMRRITAIEKELFPNGGSSFRDQIVKLSGDVADLAARLPAAVTAASNDGSNP